MSMRLGRVQRLGHDPREVQVRGSDALANVPRGTCLGWPEPAGRAPDEVSMAGLGIASSVLAPGPEKWGAD